VVKGPKSAREIVKRLRVAARSDGYRVERLVGRGKGSHSLWVLSGPAGAELARTTIPEHPGDLSLTVTRSIESAFEPWLGKGWMER
jgi:hypothetical protein